jgi:hypothetical protein
MARGAVEGNGRELTATWPPSDGRGVEVPEHVVPAPVHGVVILVC